jgi:hypothetical protein
MRETLESFKKRTQLSSEIRRKINLMNIMKSPYSQLRKPGSGEEKFLLSERKTPR